MKRVLKTLYNYAPRDYVQFFKNSTGNHKRLHFYNSDLSGLSTDKNYSWQHNESTNYLSLNFQNVDCFESNVIEKLESQLCGFIPGTQWLKSEMTPKERLFINGIIRKCRPKTIVEIGISAGGSSCLILNAIKDISDATLYSFDYNNYWYRAKKNKKHSGFLVRELIDSSTQKKWVLNSGGNANDHFGCLPKAGVDICLIDTVHSNPGEHLNILEILPYMKKNGIIIFHDSAYHIKNSEGYTNRVAINTLCGKRIFLTSEETKGLPNIEAVVLCDDIDSSLPGLFSNLSLPWTYSLSEKDYFSFLKHFNKFYKFELVKLFIFYSTFYLNGGQKNRPFSLEAAERALS